jgi:predicted metal-dependent TIM-barrel fold hydrolase
MYARTTDDYEAMKKSGYVAVIEPAFWSGTDRTSAGSYYDYFTHLLEFENSRARKYGLYHYSLLGVNAKEARHTEIAFEVVDNLKKYLEHPNCIGVGEIGLDLITPEEEEVFKRQVELAEKHKMLVIIHSPHTNKRVGVERMLGIMKNVGVNMKRYVMDHNTEETIGITLKEPDIIAGMTLYPTKVNNERAAKMIKEYGANRILINSSADWGKSYPLNLAEAASQFPGFGLSEKDINKVVFQNAFDFFSQSPKFRLED